MLENLTPNEIKKRAKIDRLTKLLDVRSRGSDHEESGTQGIEEAKGSANV